MDSTADEPAERAEAAEAAVLRIGMSPYATGGGGVTFERKVAVGYLALLLTREGATELGEGRSVVSVAFQQAPDHPIDDLVVRASRAGESEVGLVLALAVRRAPNIVKSDDSMRKLTREFVRALVSVPTDGTEYRFALVVAGWQVHSSELASLASTAAAQMDAPAFFGLIRTPAKFPQDLVRRLDHVVALVKLALEDLGTADLDTTLTNLRTWELLSRLVVLMPRLETPDESDWTAVQNRLVPVARGLDLAVASRLRDRLLTLADEYPSKAATVNQTVLRRDVHGLLDKGARRHAHGWAALDLLHQQAIGSMRDAIVAADGARRLHVDRSDVESAMLEAAAAPALVVHGESGVGKSALTIRAATAAAEADAGAVQVRCINLRQLPPTSLALESALGAPLAEVLDDLSAPLRMIIIDGADAVAEGQAEVFRYVIDAAQKADVSVVAVTATDNKQVVHDTLIDRFGPGVVEYVIPPLTDVQLNGIVETFAELRTLAANARSRELLRRLVVTDLLVRSGVSGVPLSDADAMRQVWACLVRRREHTDRGMPDAREIVLLHLAGFALSGGNALAVATDLDAVALDGLRRDGLLRASADNEWQILPEFSHDEIRRYAVARLLLVNGDPAGALVDAGAPRWALPAARLACQAVLDGPDRASQPIHGRFERLQAAFDALVDSGRGARWGDVPAEALLAVGDPEPLLADAWQSLRSHDASGLKRLGRLIDQRHRKHGVVDAIVIEPIITLLLDDPAPWWSGEYIANMLREWLHALVLADAPRGQPLRARLRERLIAACDAGDARLVREREEAAAALAARTPEEIEEESERRERNRALLAVIGHGGRERRDHPVVPQEVTDDTVLEVLALLGPDLGDEGERILRRVARDAPWHLAPAVEEALTGRALASFGHGLLADLTEAYYLDEKDDSGSGLMDDGIRDHHTRGLITPLCAWYRGPFMPLFQTDLRRGLVVLNRMLNHAARVRVRTLAGLHDPWGQVPPEDVAQFQSELRITGERRTYVGDGHVWLWYRGTGVGPYPCMSALQALEIVCDQCIAAGVPLATLVARLLDGCENLAMPGLVVGMLMRHIERAGTLLDPFLIEPEVWHLEVNRLVAESSGMAATSEHTTEPARRKWTLREAAGWLTMTADVERAVVLCALGDALVANAVRLVASPSDDGNSTVDAGTTTDPAAAEYVTTVRNWASALDRDRYRTFEQDGMTYVQAMPTEDVIVALRKGNEDLERGQHAMRIMWRYFVQLRRDDAEPITDEELAADLEIAKDLFDDPPRRSAYDRWDAPAAISAFALDAYLLRGARLPSELIEFAARTVLSVAEGAVPAKEFEYEGTMFEQGPDRSAARAIPLLLLPVAQHLRSALGDGSDPTAYLRVVEAGMRLAHAIADETRLHLCRGLDCVWSSGCSPTACHHEDALAIALESMRDCVLGPWNSVHQRREIVALDEPLVDTLAATPADSILMSRLDAAIRACGSAAVADVCVSARARDALFSLVTSQRKALLAHEHNYDERGTHALVTARALLNVAALGYDAPLHDQIAEYASNGPLLGGLLRALAAAAEETRSRADACGRLWPAVIRQVLELSRSGHQPFSDRYFGDLTLASLMPAPTYEGSFLYRELDGTPIVWSSPLAWHSEIDTWLTFAAGNARATDALIGLLRSLPMTDQVRSGLPWVCISVFGDVDAVARGSYSISSWLTEVRDTADALGVLDDWQRVVDALVVAGDATLSAYSE